jgi:co-chaperonin GroES (HSP10)|tara:strand:- start:59 stop:568 length:510 start_codon:yes stop_codon:yes gene_type:complete
MTKSKIDMSAAPSAAFQMEAEKQDTQPKKEAVADASADNLKDAYVDKPVLRPENIGKSLLDKMPAPTGWRILILPYRGKGQTEGGIYLPDQLVQEQSVSTQVGYVLKVGPLAYKDPDKFPSGAWCEEKDWVMFARYAGSRFAIDGGEVRILNDDEILAKILDPEDVLHY